MSSSMQSFTRVSVVADPKYTPESLTCISSTITIFPRKNTLRFFHLPQVKQIQRKEKDAMLPSADNHAFRDRKAMKDIVVKALVRHDLFFTCLCGITYFAILLLS